MAAPSEKSPAGTPKQASQANGKKAFALRLDPAVHAAVERLAGAELRSANAQIEILLREALNARGIAPETTARPRRGRPPKAKLKPEA